MAETRKKNGTAKQNGTTRATGGTGKNGTGKKNSTAKRSNTVSNPNTSKKQMEQQIEEDNREVRLEVILLVILAFSIFLMIANFGKCGKVGDAISGFLFGVIGFAEYIFPVYLFISSAFIISNLGNKKVRNEVIYIGVVLMIISMISQMIFTTDYLSVKQLYLDGYKEHMGGGIICGGLFFIFRNTIGIVGVTLVMILGALVMFVLITGISVIDTFKDLINSFYREEEYEEPEQECRPVKKNKKKSGKSGNSQVRLENLKVYESGEKQKGKAKDFFENEDEIHEINVPDDDFLTFNNDVEKIVLHDEREEQIPVSFAKKTSVTKSRRKSEPAPVETAAGVSSAVPMGDTQEIPVQQTKDIFDAEFEDEEDVLSGAINGNEHPEVVSVIPDDYDPDMDSAFSSVTGKTENSQTVKKHAPAADKPGQKNYKEGAKYKFPGSNLLAQPPKNHNANRDAQVRSTAIKLKNTLENFGVNVTITNYSCGPAVTRFEMQPEQGVKVSKILGLADDIKLNLAAADIRIEAPIPGKAAIGIEVPNKENSIVAFRELVESDNFKNSKSNIAFAVGKDISGQVIVTDIAKMPHLLIAGATGSGKSVCINTLIMSILYKAKPEEVKLIMIDPKMVELACYNGIPHLLIPVVTDPKKASGALNWAVEEMTRRYQMFAECGVRNIQGYNDKVEQALASGSVDDEKLKKMPTIVVIVDELADLMMVVHGEVEDAIVRLSQLARAAGIHLVIATQRPSVDVITGLIKANVPSRIAFAVSSGVDSRTILDMNGAEKLLGKGDMLFYPTGYPKPVRVQGAFVSDEEVSAVVEYLKKQNGVGTYDDDISKSITQTGAAGAPGMSGGSEKDDYFVEAGRFIIDKEKASIGMLQRAFKIGFNRAARIMDQLAGAGVVGPEEGTKARKILMTQEEFDEYIDNNL